MSDANAELMQKIRGEWGALIDGVCASSSVLPSFLAALVANESGGDPHARRFEPHTLVQLWNVLLDRVAMFGSITRADLLGVLMPASTAMLSPYAAALAIDELASSHGLTQIMGYEILDRSINTGSTTIAELEDPEKNLTTSLSMLAQFAHRFGLDVTKDFSQLFDCWNTGRPKAPTFDPNYITNGLARMTAYALAANSEATAT